MKKFLVLIYVLVSLPVFAGGDLLDLVVISDYESANMAPKRNVTANRVDDRWNRRTVFAQTADGTKGYRIIFAHPGENVLRHGDLITLATEGCAITVDPETGETTIAGVQASRNIRSCEKSAVAPVAKNRTITTLTDNDINTLVELPGLDFVFKDGSYANIHEVCIGRMDGWASLLRDKDGHAIYMLVNMDCPWRRTGKAIPQGNVSVKGILVREDNRRYGPMGRYSIRPLDDSFITPESKQSEWKPVVGWEKSFGSACSLDFEISGTVSDLFKSGVKNDKIYNDLGNSAALLWTDSDSEARVYSGFNSVSKDNDGTVKNGAIMFVGPSAGWYEWSEDGKPIDSKAFYIKTSTSKFKSGSLQLAFEWSAGTGDGNKACYFPVDWRIEYSADGKVWFALKDDATNLEEITLHSVPWGDTKIKASGHENMKLSPTMDAGMGPQQHVFTLPQSALGCKELYVRISPASTYLAKPRVQFETTYRDEIVSPSAKNREAWIRFDSIRLDYRK